MSPVNIPRFNVLKFSHLYISNLEYFDKVLTGLFISGIASYNTEDLLWEFLKIYKYIENSKQKFTKTDIHGNKIQKGLLISHKICLIYWEYKVFFCLKNILKVANISNLQISIHLQWTLTWFLKFIKSYIINIKYLI